MRTDSEVIADVLRELQWDPQVTDPSEIGVAVRDGAVTLTGPIPAFAEGLAAVRAAARVDGVTAVADELRVRLAGQPRDDADIARAIAHVLEWNTQVPEGQVQAQLQAGWATLDGRVDFGYQRREVERVVGHVRGVVGITNNVVVTSPVSAAQVEAEIEDAFRREAEVDARHVEVHVSGHTAELYGRVHSRHEVAAAEAAAAAAPGVDQVESHLVVAP
jgi:osmotically-inducible protein OsmY